MHRLCDDSEGKNFQRSKQGKSGKTVAMLVIPRSRICEKGFDIFISFTHFFTSGKDILYLK